MSDSLSVWKKDSHPKKMKIVKLIVGGILAAVLLWLLFLLYDKLNPVDISEASRTSRVVTAYDGSWLYAQTNSEDKWRFGVDINKLDPNYIEMLLAFEDKNFYSHHGLDILAMLRAIGQLIVNQKIVSGGSTITMQLARLLNPKPRTIASKIREIIKAFQIELHNDKDEILSAYLSLTPYGGNVEGVVAASMRYFGKLPQSLTASQSAILVSLPQSPEKNRPDKHLKNSLNARDKVLKMAYEKSIINRYQYQQALKEQAPTKLKRYPRYAPHLSQKLLLDKQIKQKEIATTLDAQLQKQLERWLKEKSHTLPKDTTIALLVVKNSDSSVQAYLGSHDRFSSRVTGFVDMVQAIRSPGSTLKPFIYALGFEKHFIHPNSVIVDQETLFGDYMPHNFSYKYSGEVTVAQALKQSLNIPAVKVLQKIGVEDFLSRLRSYVKDIYIPKNRASLPIALGGAGLSLWSLTDLYVGLANGGEAKHIHYFPHNEGAEVKRLTDAKSSKMITAILREVTPPQSFINRNNMIAYKTGTSYGYRDNWSIAYTKEYTIALWAGKPNNATQFKRTGRMVAAPLVFEAFALLESIRRVHSWQWQSNYLGDSVPAGLKYFDEREVESAREKLSLIYPRDNSRFKNAGCGDTLIEFKIEQGTPPYSWYVDDTPREISKTDITLPFERGAHTITIIDSKGDTIHTNIWVDEPECG